MMDLYNSVVNAIHGPLARNPDRVCVEGFWQFDSIAIRLAINYAELCGYKYMQVSFSVGAENERGTILFEAWKQKPQGWKEVKQ